MIKNKSILQYRELAALKDFSDNALNLLDEIAEIKEYVAGSVVVPENIAADALYILLEGIAEVYKDDSTGVNRFITHIPAGEFIGELSFIEGGTYSATVIAGSYCKCYKIPFKAIKDNRNKELHLNIVDPIYRKISGRLRDTTRSMVKKLHEQLELGTTSSIIILIITCYNLIIAYLNQQHVLSANTLYTTVALLVIMMIITFIILKRSIYPMSTFGVNFKAWRRDLFLGVVYSLPLLTLMLLFKIFLVWWLQPVNDTIFSFRSGFGYYMSWTAFFYNLLIYSIFCIAQEFVVRSGVQASFYNFLLGTPAQRAWLSIVLSALVFASTHMHVSMGAAFTAVPLGIYWGYLFYRTNSLISVSVSHIVVGDIGLFVIGYYHLF